MEGLIVGIGKGAFGDSGTPLVLGNLWEFLNPEETKAAVLANEDTFTVTQEEKDNTLNGKDIKLLSEGAETSTVYFYEGILNGTSYTFIRHNAATNFMEFGSNDFGTDIISARIDRGKKDWEFQDFIKIKKVGRGVVFFAPGGVTYELRTNDGGVLELWSRDVENLSALVWSASALPTNPDFSNLGSYTDDAAAATGGVAVGYGYVNSSTGAVHRRLT